MVAPSSQTRVYIETDDKLSFDPEGARNDRLQELFDLSSKVDQDDLRKRLKTTALLVKWESRLDDLGLASEFKDLRDVLEMKYGYAVDLIELQEKDPQQQIAEALESFIEKALCDGCNTVVVYYGGHGRRGLLGQLDLEYHREGDFKPDEDREVVHWEPVEEYLRGVDLNILVILDCCYAGSRADRRFRPQSQVNSMLTKDRKFEVLCAAGSSKETLGKSNEEMITFTDALIWALEQLLSTPIFTTSQLLQTLFAAPKLSRNHFPELWKRDLPKNRDITLGSLLNAKDVNVKAHDRPKQAYFDLRFHVENRPNEAQLQELIGTVREMSKEGVFTPKRIEWIGFKTTEGKVKDLNVLDGIDFELFDCVATSATLSSENSDRSDDWIDKVQECVNKRFSSKEPPENTRVKIAILDSGYDATHTLFKHVPHNVKGNVSFMEGIESDPHARYFNIESDCDINGHGTHGTYLLSTIAPNAYIYMAKVTDGSRYWSHMADALSSAIRYACDTWKVDIITMSLGFPYYHEKVKRAIEYAKDKALMFAAASNHGANLNVPIAFPARADGVFCIHSTDAYGNPSKFTPKVLPSIDNFATLGEDVRSAWPKDMRKGLEHRLTGTSVATPIAAGIAALILEFGRQDSNDKEIQLDDEEIKLLRTYNGMRQVLLDMAGENTAGRTEHPDYLYLNPVEFFEGRREENNKVTKALERIKVVLGQEKQRRSTADN